MATRYKALLEERADLVAEGRETFTTAERESRALNAEEIARDDAINARLAEISAELVREEARRERERTVAAVPNGSAPAAGVLTLMRNAAGQLVDGSGALVALNANGYPRLVPVGTPDASGRFESGRDLANLKPWGSDTGAPLGEFLQAVRRHRTGAHSDQRLFAGGQGMNEGVGSDGGFLVQQDLKVQIESRFVDGGELLSRVDRIPIGPNSNGLKLTVLDETSRATGSRYGGVRGYWLGEGDTKTASRPTFAQIELRLKKLAALGYATDELLEDAMALERVMTVAFGDELRFAAEDSILNGTGAGQPLGILNSPALVSVSKETGQGAATIVAQNIIKMWSRLWAPSRRTAVWIMNQDIEGALMSMSFSVGTGGVPVWLPANGLSGEPFNTLFGRPVIPVEYSATLGTVGDILLVDPKEYAWIEKGGVQTAQSIHVAFVTDETAFRAVMRVDGAPKWRAPLTPYKGTGNTVSPFVALATRA